MNWTHLTESPVVGIYKHWKDHSASLEGGNFLTNRTTVYGTVTATNMVYK